MKRIIAVISGLLIISGFWYLSALEVKTNAISAESNSSYVNVTGDTMTGNLSIPALTLSNTITGNYADNTGLAADTQLYSLISEMNMPLTSGIEVSNILGRVRWKHGGNSNAILNGVEGVCSSTTTDESITCRGGSFRTYTATGGTIRTSIGADISARAGIPLATDIVAESGTAFVGARIWMAPGFTGGSIANVNNFHGLWIYNEHDTNAVTNAIFISDAGGGFTKDLTLQHGESIDNATDGTISVTAPISTFSGTISAIGGVSSSTSSTSGYSMRLRGAVTDMTQSTHSVNAGDLWVTTGSFALVLTTTTVGENSVVCDPSCYVTVGP